MIIILCGPVGVGKTTISERLSTELKEKGLDCKIMHSDDFSTHTYDQMFEKVKDSDKNWILDGTFYRVDIRERFGALDDVLIIWLKADLETCLERNEMRGKSLEEKVVHIMFHKFEEPDADIVVDTDDLGPYEVVDKILKDIFQMEGIK